MSDSLRNRTAGNAAARDEQPTPDSRSLVNGRGAPSRPSLTVSWLEIEDWQRDNDYILTGYRRAQNNFRGCLASVFGYLHNETVNIHTHLWGAILFAFFVLTYSSTYLSAVNTVTWVDYTVFAVSLLGAIGCLTASATMHTCRCHSEPVLAACSALDYTGIVVLIVGSFFPCVHYGFFCEPYLKFIYLAIITLSGSVASAIVLNPEYARPTHRGARTKVFIALGLSAVLPVGHGLVSHGFDKLMTEMGFRWLVLSGALYIAGALLYANRIPERYAPGKFDHIGASHQIFHVAVVLAALAHYRCVVISFKHWHLDMGGRCVL